MRCPCVVLSYGVEQSLQPRVSFLEDILDACPEVSEKRRNLSARLREESSRDEDVDAWASPSSPSSGSDWDEPLAPAEPVGPLPESLVAQVILRCATPFLTIAANKAPSVSSSCCSCSCSCSSCFCSLSPCSSSCLPWTSSSPLSSSSSCCCCCP